MPDVNTLIKRKLEKYPKEVIEFALKAIELCEEYPYQTVAEQLEEVVRRIVRNSGENR